MTISTQRLRLLRGNTAAASAFTGLQGELIFDTTLYTLRLQDGLTPGGYTLATSAQLANVAANANYGNSNVGAYLTTYTGNLTAGNILSNNYLYANGVSILTGIQSNYGNANVAAYLLANPQPGTYSNTNVVAYLVANPQPGTYSNTNVAAYLVANPQSGTYSNTNVASYLVANPQPGTYSNTNVASYLPTYTGNIAANIVKNNQTWEFVANGNLRYPDGTLYSGSNITVPTGTGNVFRWKFNDLSVGSETITLDWNLLGTKNFGQWYLATNDTAKYWLLDSDTKQLSFSNAGAVDGGGKLTFGTATLGGTGNINDIELTSTVSNVFVNANNQVWIFESTGNLIVPNGINAGLVASPAPRITGFAISTPQVIASGNISAANFIGNIQGPSTVYGNLNVTGNLIVSGNTITVSTNNFVVSDNIIFMANNNPANLLDIGFAAHYTTDTLRHTGFVKDVNGGTWKLFSNVPQEITTEVNFTDAIYDPIQTGNVTAPYFIGNGALLTGIAASSNYGNANVAGFLGSYGSNTIVTTGNISGGYFVGNGALLTGIVASGSTYSNTNVAAYLPIYGGPVNANVITGTANATVNGLAVNNSVTVGTTLGVTGNINGSGLTLSGSLRATGTGDFDGGLQSTPIGNVAGMASTGSFTTITANANVTASALAVNNTATIGSTLGVTGNITTTGNVTVTANVVAGNLITSGSGGNISGVNIVYGNVVGSGNSTVQDFTVNGNATIGGNLTISGVYAGYAPARPAMRVYGNTSSQFTANTTISNQAIDFNQGSYYNNSTGLFTAPVAGLFHCYATVRVGNNNALNQAALLKNGTLSGANVISFWETDTNTGTASHFSMTGYAKCVVGDTISLKVIAGNVQFDSNDSWGVTYIG